MRLIIAGSRSITDYDIVEEAVFEWVDKLIQAKKFENVFLGGDLFTVRDNVELNPASYITEIVSGKAKGVDALGEDFAEAYGIPIKPFPAEWDRYGKAAGGIRNYRMSVYGHGLCAVWDGKSSGTANMISWAHINKLFMHVKQIKVR